MLLAINSCTQKIEVALEFQGEIIYHSSFHEKNDSEFILNSIHKSLQDLHKTAFDIQTVICVKGPASFTACRIGVIIANTLKSQTNCQLYELNTLEYLSLFVEDSEEILLSAGGKDFYCYRGQEIKLYNVSELDKDQYFSNVTEKQSKLIPAHITQIPIEVDLKVLVDKFLHKEITLVEVTEIEPEYVKDPNIDYSKLPATANQKSGYFMVLMSFVIVFLMTPLMLNLFNNEISQIENFRTKRFD